MWTVQGVVPFSVKFCIIFKVFSLIVSLASVPVPHPPLQKFLNILLRSTHTDYVTSDKQHIFEGQCGLEERVRVARVASGIVFVHVSLGSAG